MKCILLVKELDEWQKSVFEMHLTVDKWLRYLHEEF
jgi:hypothetical protein